MMKTKIWSMLLLLIVVVGFSGVASAGTLKLISEAWDETVLVSPAVPGTPGSPGVPEVLAVEYQPEVLAQDAVEAVEAVPETNLNVSGVGPNFEFIDDISRLVAIDAAWADWELFSNNIIATVPGWIYVSGGLNEVAPVFKTVTVIDQAAVDAWDELIKDAYDEQKLVKEAYDETISVEADHNGWTLNAAKEVQQKAGSQPINVNAVSHGKPVFNIGDIKNGYIVADDVGQGVNKIWVSLMVPKVVHHPAVYETVHHDAVYLHHDAVPAVTHEEQQLVTPGYVFINNHYEAHTDAIAAVEGKDAVAYKPEVKAVEHQDAIPAVPATPAVDAVYKVIHHPAVYVEIADPIKPSTEETIPMEETGAASVPFVVAVVLILSGLGIALVLARRNE